MNLSQTLSHSTASGLRQLFSVDADIPVMLQHLTQGTKDPLQYPQGATAATGQDTSRFESCLRLQQSLVRTLLTHRRVYVYGCGATGRLAKHFESAFWRPFWGRVMTDKKLSDIASVIKQKLSPTLLDDCVGEMTGADRALIASLEGFEDLQLIGALQLSEHGIKKGDVIITVTEGGETSSVIGTVLAGVKQWEEAGSSTASADEIRSHHYFLYNNPDHVLLPFDRSAAVIRDDRITKINLSTGPQAITGSTRMQATSSETFVLAAIFHVALEELFRVHLGLNAEQLSRIGFGEHKGTSAELLKQKLQEFDVILSTATASVDSLATFTDWETECYRQQHFTTYFAQKGLMSVFIDNTERSPTFRLFPLDRIDLKDRRNCLLQIWTKGSNLQEAWINFLGRPFCGMNYAHYEQPFLKEIKDEYLKEVAMRSLPQATNDQQELYDFSFSEENMRRRGGINHKGDLGCLVVLDEEIAELKEPNSAMCRFAQEFLKVDEAGEYNSRLEIMIITSPEHLVAHGFADVSSSAAAATEAFYNLPTLKSLPRARLHLTLFLLPTSLNDPLSIRSQLLTKLSLNAHSTAVMAKLGKVLGNFMVNVSPSNLKLIGRATHLILAQVNALADKYKVSLFLLPLKQKKRCSVNRNAALRKQD